LQWTNTLAYFSAKEENKVFVSSTPEVFILCRKYFLIEIFFFQKVSASFALQPFGKIDLGLCPLKLFTAVINSVSL
jgi:hypothetical protein